MGQHRKMEPDAQPDAKPFKIQYIVLPFLVTLLYLFIAGISILLIHHGMEHEPALQLASTVIFAAVLFAAMFFRNRLRKYSSNTKLIQVYQCVCFAELVLMTVWTVISGLILEDVSYNRKLVDDCLAMNVNGFFVCLKSEKCKVSLNRRFDTPYCELSIDFIELSMVEQLTLVKGFEFWENSMDTKFSFWVCSNSSKCVHGSWKVVTQAVRILLVEANQNLEYPIKVYGKNSSDAGVNSTSIRNYVGGIRVPFTAKAHYIPSDAYEQSWVSAMKEPIIVFDEVVSKFGTQILLVATTILVWIVILNIIKTKKWNAANLRNDLVFLVLGIMSLIGGRVIILDPNGFLIRFGIIIGYFCYLLMIYTQKIKACEFTPATGRPREAHTIELAKLKCKQWVLLIAAPIVSTWYGYVSSENGDNGWSRPLGFLEIGVAIVVVVLLLVPQFSWFQQVRKREFYMWTVIFALPMVPITSAVLAFGVIPACNYCVFAWNTFIFGTVFGSAAFTYKTRPSSIKYCMFVIYFGLCCVQIGKVVKNTFDLDAYHVLGTFSLVSTPFCITVIVYWIRSGLCNGQEESGKNSAPETNNAAL